MIYDPVQFPKGIEKQRILEAQSLKPNCRMGGSPGLLFVSLWLGLRPVEVDQLNSKKGMKCEERSGIKIFLVYQSKLTAAPVEKRWKPIPLIIQEQQVAIHYLSEGCLKRPRPKTLQKALNDSRCGTYAGRKGFTDLMLSYSQRIEDISVWLGHSSIQATWKYYKNKQAVSFLPPTRIANSL